MKCITHFVKTSDISRIELDKLRSVPRSRVWFKLSNVFLTILMNLHHKRLISDVITLY